MPAQPTGITVKDVDVHKFNRAYAQFLKNSGKVEIPKWVDIVKTGVHKELSPYDPDWFYIRIASIARHVYMRSPVGVGALTRIYGGKKRRGVCPGKFAKSSGSIARAGLAQLEKMKLIQKAANGGRIITSEGQRDLDRIASQVYAAQLESSQEGVEDEE